MSVLALTVLCFLPILHFDFVYDDSKQVLGNENIHSLRGLVYAFTENVWSFDPTKSGGGRYYRPYFIVILTLGWQAFGANPYGYHSLNLALHLLCGVLLFRLARALKRWRESFFLCWILTLLVQHRYNLTYWHNNLSLYERTAEVASDNPHFLMNLSNERTRHEIGDPSCELLKRAEHELDRDPRRGDAILLHYNFGNCLRKRGDRETALQQYAAAQRLANDNFLEAGINQAVTLNEMERFDEAIAPRASVYPRLFELRASLDHSRS